MRPSRLRNTAFRVPLAFLLLALAGAAHADEARDPSGRVARVSLTQGTVSLEPAGTETWIADVLNRPLTTGDKLWADRESRAELHVGSTAVRLGSSTGMALLNLDDRNLQLQLTAGTLELRVRSLAPDETLEVATPTASVSVLRPGDYRIDVGDAGEGLKVAVANGQAAVTGSGQAYTVNAGQLAEYPDATLAAGATSPLPAGDAFDQWVGERDRREDRAQSARYVSRDVIGYEDLDDYGTWSSVPTYGNVWVPSGVAVGWAPYRYGHWAWISPWGWTWIDEAPWGFAPFHYGRWVFLGGRWCWAPGAVAARAYYAPALVGWVGGSHWSVSVSIGGGPAVGWFPLGWNEVWVPAYRASPTYVRNVNITSVTNVTNITNVYNTTVNNTVVSGGQGGASGRRYANQTVPGAVTATSQAVFTNAQPVGRHLATVPLSAAHQAESSTAAPAIAPTAQSIGPRAPAVATPPRALWTRPVVARRAPPVAPVPFAEQQRMISANGGRPVALRDMAERLPAAQASRLAPPVRVLSAPPAVAPGAAAGVAPPRPIPAPGRPSPAAGGGRAEQRLAPPPPAVRTDRPAAAAGGAAAPQPSQPVRPAQIDRAVTPVQPQYGDRPARADRPVTAARPQSAAGTESPRAEGRPYVAPRPPATPNPQATPRVPVEPRPQPAAPHPAVEPRVQAAPHPAVEPRVQAAPHPAPHPAAATPPPKSEAPPHHEPEGRRETEH